MIRIIESNSDLKYTPASRQLYVMMFNTWLGYIYVFCLLYICM